MSKEQRFRANLSPEARADIEDILLWTIDRFGPSASERYEELIIQALRDLEDDPMRLGTKERNDLPRDLRSYHLSSSRDHVAGRRVKEPRHFIIFHRPSNGGLEIVRILHDSRDLPRLLPEK